MFSAVLHPTVTLRDDSTGSQLHVREPATQTA